MEPDARLTTHVINWLPYGCVEPDARLTTRVINWLPYGCVEPDAYSPDAQPRTGHPNGCVHNGHREDIRCLSRSWNHIYIVLIEIYHPGDGQEFHSIFTIMDLFVILLK